jgi:hypothetical protein
MMFYDYQYEILNKPEKTFHEKRELVKQLIKLKIRGNKMAKSKTSPKKPPMPMPSKKKGAC